jgi:putative hemolysin
MVESKKRNAILIVLGILILVALCLFVFYSFTKKVGGVEVIPQENSPVDSSVADPNPLQIANPASVYCEENNGILEMREDSQGGQYGVCINNGKECEEWALYRGECSLE